MVYIVQDGMIGAQMYATIASKGAPAAWACSSILGTAEDWIVGAFDNLRVDHLHHWAQVARKKGMSFLPVHVQGGEVVIGPEIRPQGTGCLHCWEKRYFCGRPWLRRFADLAAEHNDTMTDPWLTATAAAVVGRIAAQRLLDGALPHGSRASAISDWWVYYFDLKNFSGREWRLVPDPVCSQCAQVESDSPARASITLRSYVKPDPDSDRLCSLKELQFVRQAFTGHRCNIVENGKQSWPVRNGVVVSFGVALIAEAHPEPCSGFCSRHSDAETAAILESVERYSGAEPRGFIPSVRGSFSELREYAVNPRTFGLHSEREYKANPGVNPYTDDLEMRFVWAHSFRERRQVLVPLQIGFYSRPRPGDNLFVLGEGSSGCAVGTRLEEAILHGVFEVAERDAYMLTWLAMLSPPRLDLTECDDPEVRHVLRRLRGEGFEVMAFDITTDLGIPAVGLLARRDKTWPHLLCAASAHLNPERALKKAFRELVGGVSLWELSGELARPRALELASNPDRVRKPMEHGLMYTAAMASRHCEFLAANPSTVSLSDMGRSVQGLRSDDLGVELTRTIDRIIANGFDVIVVKHTGSEPQAQGLHVAKVLIPGAIPAAWGDHLRRVENLPRLDAALVKNGRTAPNPIPHPFP